MARDAFHNAVRHALEKEGWRITSDPLRLEYKGAKLEIDLGAERFIAAERNEERIAVEIKSFASGSALSEFHTALGQYLNYRRALEQSEPTRKLFLAVPRDTFETFFQLPFTQEAVAFHNLALIVYQPITEVIVQWN
jgi:XisH protein